MDSIAASLSSGLSRALVAMGREREAIAVLKQSFDYYVEIDDEANAVATVESPYTTLLVRNLKDILEQALTLVPHGSVRHARILNAYGLSIGLRGYGYESSMKAFEEARAIARKERDVPLEIQTLAAAANIDGFHARWRQSLEKGLLALDLASQIDIDPIINLRANQWVANSYRCLGFPERAQARASELVTRSQSLHDVAWLDRSLLQSITLAYVAGQWQEVSSLARQGRTPEHQQYFCVLEALSEFQRGDFERGENLLYELLPSTNVSHRAPGYISLSGA